MGEEKSSAGPRVDGGEPAGDGAAAALERLVVELGLCIEGLERARCRAVQLQEQRRAGRTWQDIVADEQHPLIVELVSEVMASLATAGGRWRREEALALQAEGLSINRIAAQFGVTRQRISALIKAGGAGSALDR